jgi:hypothetical protein
MGAVEGESPIHTIQLQFWGSGRRVVAAFPLHQSLFGDWSPSSRFAGEVGYQGFSEPT